MIRTIAGTTTRGLGTFAAIALGLVAFGLIGFPAIIFVVGQRLIGDYEAGLLGYYESLANALASGNPFAWILIFSPYLGIQLFRLLFWLRKAGRDVT